MHCGLHSKWRLISRPPHTQQTPRRLAFLLSLPVTEPSSHNQRKPACTGLLIQQNTWESSTLWKQLNKVSLKKKEKKKDSYSHRNSVKKRRVAICHNHCIAGQDVCNTSDDKGLLHNQGFVCILFYHSGMLLNVSAPDIEHKVPQEQPFKVAELNILLSLPFNLCASRPTAKFTTTFLFLNVSVGWPIFTFAFSTLIVFIWGCTSGGVYVLCIYSPGELSWTTLVFVVVFVCLSSTN